MCVSDADSRELGEIFESTLTTPESKPAGFCLFKFNLVSGSITLNSRYYWTSPELFDNSKTGLKLAKAYANYAKDNIKPRIYTR